MASTNSSSHRVRTEVLDRIVPPRGLDWDPRVVEIPVLAVFLHEGRGKKSSEPD